MCKNEQCVNRKKSENENTFEVKLKLYSQLVSFILVLDYASVFNLKYGETGVAKVISIIQLALVIVFCLLLFFNDKINKFITQQGMKSALELLPVATIFMLCLGLVMKMLSLFEVNNPPSLLFCNLALWVAPLSIFLKNIGKTIFTKDNDNNEECV